MSEELHRMAAEYAKRTTNTRCSHMGTSECDACTYAQRGNCDYRVRRESFIEGYIQGHRMATRKHQESIKKLWKH